MKFLIILIASLALPALANPIHNNLASSGSKFELLKSHYEAATLPAKALDFDHMDDEDSNQTCVFVKTDETDEILESVIINRLTIVIPGEPSHGPLFPGIPDREETKVVLLSSKMYMKLLAPAFHNEVTTTDFIMWTDFDGRLLQTPWKFYFRSSQDLVFFHGYLRYQKENSVEYYGYCYREDQ